MKVQTSTKKSLKIKTLQKQNTAFLNLTEDHRPISTLNSSGINKYSLQNKKNPNQNNQQHINSYLLRSCVLYMLVKL